MTRFETLPLPSLPSIVAPDGSDVRVLLGLRGGTMAHFSLAPGRVSLAVAHRTVEEIWFVIAGRGRMWRRQDDVEEIVNLVPGMCLSVPHGTSFQFRADGATPLEAVAITMPPWPGDDEAYVVAGAWQSC
jgi:mannose-6-phosphate isomerase-like protein (cupin superfamily)